MFVKKKVAAYFNLSDLQIINTIYPVIQYP